MCHRWKVRINRFAIIAVACLMIALFFKTISWVDVYEQCITSPWTEVQSDMLVPITFDTATKLQRAEIFENQLATSVQFDPSGRFLIMSRSRDYAALYADTIVTDLEFPCAQHNFRVLDGYYVYAPSANRLRGGYAIQGCLEAISNDGQWLMVTQCNSLQNWTNIHRIQLKTGNERVFSEAEYQQWLQENHIELAAPDPESNFSIDHSLVAEIIEQQPYDQVVLRDTTTGNIVKDVSPSLYPTPCDSCGSGIHCGITVDSAIFSPDGKYLLIRFMPYCGSGFYQFIVWVVPDTPTQ